jgi:hypothetical protein
MKVMESGKLRLQIYRVTAQVYASDGNSTVWEGTLDDVIAAGRRDAREVARQRIIDTVPEYDERIHPGIRIVSIERAETDPVFLAHRIVAEAEKHGQETSAHGDLEHALQLCVERMSMGQIAGVLQQLQSQK